MPAPYTLTITNPGAETGDMSGWTQLRGFISASGSAAGTTPNTGSFFFAGGSPTASLDYNIYYQDIDVSAVPDSTAELDDESLQIDLEWYQANSFPDDTGMMYVEFYDSIGDQIGGYVTAPLVDITPEDTWELRSLSVALPPNTRTIRLHMVGRLEAGSTANVNFDDISAELVSRTVSLRNRHAVIKFRDTTGSLPSNINEALGTSPSIADLVDQDGVSTGWSLSTNDAFDQASDNAEDFFPFGPNIYGDGYLVCDEFGDEEGEIEIGGLDTAKTYAVRVAAYRSSASRDANYIIEGETTFNLGFIDAAYAYFDPITLTGVVPDGSGTIRIRMETPDGKVSRFGYINAVEIEEDVASTGNVRATTSAVEVAYSLAPNGRVTASAVEVAYAFTTAAATGGQPIIIIVE